MSQKSPLPGPDEDGNQTAPYEPLDDATSPYEPVDDPEATRPLTRPGGMNPGAAAAARHDPEATHIADAWTGRAEVRGPIPPQDGEEWTDQEPYEPGRRWWMPILLGLLGVLAVIAAIAAATLLGGNDDNVPAPTPPATRTAAPPASSSPNPPPSSAPPSSAPPTVSTVVVPPTTGDSLAVAKGKLEALGLVVSHVVEQEDATAAPGTVLGTKPPADSVVAAGSEITVIVAKAMPSSSPEPVPSPSRHVPEESLSPAAVPNGN